MQAAVHAELREGAPDTDVQLPAPGSIAVARCAGQFPRADPVDTERAMTIGGSGDGITASDTTMPSRRPESRGVFATRGAPPGRRRSSSPRPLHAQYVSQIERGEVVPSDDLLTGSPRGSVSSASTSRRGSTYRPGAHRAAPRGGPGPARYPPGRRGYRVLSGASVSLPPGAPRSTRLRAMRGEAWALIRTGSLTEAAELLATARYPAASPTPEEEAEIAYLTAVCCYSLSTIHAAHAEFARALQLLDEIDEPNDGCARTSTSGALGATAGSATTRRHARTSTVHSSWWTRSETIGAGRRSTCRPRSWPTGRVLPSALARRYAETSRDLDQLVGDDATKGRAINNIARLQRTGSETTRP